MGKAETLEAETASPKKHSALGIASFIVSILTVMIFSLSIIDMLVTHWIFMGISLAPVLILGFGSFMGLALGFIGGAWTGHGNILANLGITISFINLGILTLLIVLGFVGIFLFFIYASPT